MSQRKRPDFQAISLHVSDVAVSRRGIECGHIAAAMIAQTGQEGKDMRERGIAAGTRPRVSPARHLLGLLRVTHPIPSALYVVMTAFLALAAARATGRSPDPVALALILIAVAGAPAARRPPHDYFHPPPH